MFKSNQNIRFDETQIQEHDQQRGKTMKITEPKTPFAYYSQETDLVDEIPPLELNDALVTAQAKQEVVSEWNDDDEVLDEEHLAKKLSFDKLRHEHYNMKNSLAVGRRLSASDLEDDE